ncbi:MAG: class I tRNA ligase family protein [Planctomycetia bacterium]|nr:class I tRNA ligase family protein [Planctomycetia bacterium]
MCSQEQLIESLPKQYEPSGAQERCAALWEQKGYFHSAPNPKKPPFTIVIPPPNVTGALHLGHALNDTLQDIMVRRARMQGYETLWVPGVDHAGIATQAVVEKRLFEQEKKTRHDIGRDALVARIWAWKEQYQSRIISQLKSIGCSCDWDRTRFTLDAVCAKAVRYFFFKLFGENLIYRGKRLVNWDTLLQTAVSDDEVIHEAIEGNFWYLHYPVIDPQPGEPEFVTVATTRPETMLGDTAVAVHPDPAAEFDRLESELLTRIQGSGERESAEASVELDELRKRRAEMLDSLILLARMAEQGRKVLLPLMNREIPIVRDEWAKPNLGTGCVKITPAHDPNDYEVGLRQKLPMINLLNVDGTYNENAGKYAGLPIKQVRAAVLADLTAGNLLVKTEDRTIEISISDRSKTPIEPFLNDQWFVKMEQLAQTAMDAVTSEEVKIHPARYAKGYLDWLGEKRDWPIGRQLWWGHRIPVWYCKGASEEDLKRAFAGRDDVLWRYDSEHDQWWVCSQEENLAADAVPGFPLVQEEDVLDTWFSSALWPHSVLGWPDKTPELDYYYPTSMLLTSRDIISLWVARMVLAGYSNTGKKPFHDVFIHPKILDKYGEGMSKSKGNGIDPVAVIEKFGADSLRFAVTWLTTDSQDVRLALDFECPHCGAIVEQTKKNRTLPKVACPKCKQEFSTQWAEREEDKALPQAPVVGERFEVARNFCNKLWNASRFVMLNLDGFKPEAVSDERLLLEDRWILSRLASVTTKVNDALCGFHFAEAARTLYDFAWDEFCSFYLEMVKTRLTHVADAPVARGVILHVLDALLRLLHPMIPFVTEEVWQRLADFAPVRGLTPTAAAESITIAPWPQADTARILPQVEEQFAVFQELLRALREIRSRQNVPPKQVVHAVVQCSDELVELLKPMAPYFQSMAATDVTAWGSQASAPALAANVTTGKLNIFVDLAELIDVEKEIVKKEKELEKLAGFIKGKEAKLSGSFVDKAPAAVVEKERQSLAELKSQWTAAHETLTSLKDCQK